MNEEATLLYNLAIIYIDQRKNDKLRTILDLLDDVNIKMNINKGIKKQEGVTLLHLACTNGTLESVKMLVSKGADVNEIYDYSITPFNNSNHSNHSNHSIRRRNNAENAENESYIEQFTPLDEAIIRLTKYNNSLEYKGTEYTLAIEICIYLYGIGAVNEMID